MRVERLPFTVYDILGYLVPGLLVIVFFGVGFHRTVIGQHFSSWNLGAFAGVLVLLGTVICAYVFGHVISIIASMTIEKLVVGTTGYPSQYLTQSGAYAQKFERESHEEIVVRAVTETTKENLDKRYFRWFGCYFLYPLYWLLIQMNKKSMLHHIIKRAEASVVSVLDRRFDFVFGQERRPMDGREWFVLVEYFVTHHSSAALHRMYNYLTLYGFCRNTSLVFYCGSFFLFICGIFYGFSIHLFAAILGSFVLSFLLMMGFLKYFRRYSHEAIMNFVVMELPELSGGKSGGKG